MPACRVRFALISEPDPLEALAVEAVVGLERLGVLDGHGPVLVAEGEREREVVGEGGGGRGGGEREASWTVTSAWRMKP